MEHGRGLREQESGECVKARDTSPFLSQATGGGDCAVRVFSLEGEKEREWDTCLPTQDLPRSVCLHGNTALCHTDHGSVDCYNDAVSKLTPVVFCTLLVCVSPLYGGRWSEMRCSPVTLC